MTIKFYHNPQSRAALTHWLLEEIGTEYEIMPVAYEDGSMRTPEFLAINPMGKIPVIVDGDTIVTETTAIAIYLADKFKTPNDLAPGLDDKRRGEYLRWIAYQSACIDPAMMQANTKVEIPRQSAGWGSVELVIDVLDQRVAKASPYLFGEWFTAADVLIGGAIGWATQFGMFEMRESFKPYLEAVQSRPAFQKVFAQ